MPDEGRTKLGDTLRLQFRNRTFKCSVVGPFPPHERLWLKFHVLPSADFTPEKTAAVDELIIEMNHDIEEHRIRPGTTRKAYYPDDKCYIVHVAFNPEDAMAAYQYQLSFGQQRPGPSR